MFGDWAPPGSAEPAYSAPPDTLTGFKEKAAGKNRELRVGKGKREDRGGIILFHTGSWIRRCFVECPTAHNAFIITHTTAT